MRWFVFLVALGMFACGCSGSGEEKAVQRSPRPVRVIRLTSSNPAQSLSVTGVIGSWKTQEIAFEVSGRVEFVIEPEKNVTDAMDGEATVLAKVDPARYETAVESAVAQIAVLEKKKSAAEIDRDSVLPAQRDAAVARVDLAQADYRRTKELFDRKAAPKAELDKDTALLANALAEVKQLDASKDAKSAEIDSLAAQIREKEAALKDANRDRDDCTLRSPFRGQVAEVHAIVGATVQKGEPVVTVQMMDPMKVEFEVSAETARTMKYKDNITIHLPGADGRTGQPRDGVIWTTDSVADPATRTFTITVLLRNYLRQTRPPAGIKTEELPKARDIWKFARGILGRGDDYYIPSTAIYVAKRKNEDGELVEQKIVWKIIDSAADGTVGPTLKVEAVPIEAEEKSLPFLNNWDLVVATVDPDADFDYEQDRILGLVDFPDDSKQEIPGGEVLFERERWELRPGDLVGVDLQGRKYAAGFYVPIEAIAEESGKTFVFVVDGDKVRKTEVRATPGPDTPGKQMRIMSAGATPLTENTRIVVGGAHYLVDGETVNVAAEATE